MTPKTLTQKITLTGTGVFAALALASCATGPAETAPSSPSAAEQQTSSSAAPTQASTSAAPSSPDDDASSTSAAPSSSASSSSAAASSSAASSSAAATSSAAASSSTSATPSSTAASSPAASATGAAGAVTAPASAAAQGVDPAAAAINAVLAAHAGAVIVEMDMDDQRKWEVDAMLDGEYKSFHVADDGAVTEAARGAFDSDALKGKREAVTKLNADKATAATVTAQEAVAKALEGRAGQTVNEVDLGEDDGRLRWEIELDRSGEDDGDEIAVDAKTGEIISAS